MQSILTGIQIITSILLITTILLQRRGGGLSSVFGGEGNIYRTRRGAEKMVFRATIMLSAVFLAAAFLNVIF